jgi:hypothetical protein
VTVDLRVETAKALRDLASLLESHPDLPIPDVVAHYFPEEGSDEKNMEEVDRVAQILRRPASREFLAAHYVVTKEFSPRVRYTVCAISDADLDKMAQEIKEKASRDTESTTPHVP